MFALSAVSSRNVACQATQPRHKGAKHHARSRPIKYNASDKRHGPAKYEPLPTPPPALIVVSKGESK
ncbi:hypothetical protein HYH02_011613 [Chlamydomonas schloesseri]|uniref:Uncharacterized protein n=1 Tax=Chlamydomonas schloesseri TaxID=2026947 RepID=A0A835SZL0_9CHLO|nr:hypothetical protein HYH02_011613 [Chlamydomonas schloesseri]|eukprot:KAG2436103.1 hypothetical protein HYH02_011613 [Chlamydomonas schloesseri]